MDVEVSVIVPVYNVEKYLSKCLDSILNQTFKNFEIICVNDCSPDRSWDILTEYANKYPNIVKILKNDKNMGLGLTRNKGIENAKGKYLLFIDSDDYIKKDYIQTYYECAEAESVDAVIGGYIRVCDGKEKTHCIANNIWATLTYGISCAKMYRRDFLINNRLRFDAYKCGEDVHFNSCAFCCGMTYKVIPYEGYYYVDNGRSITNTMNYKKNHEQIMINIFSDILKMYGDKLSREKMEILEYVSYVHILNGLIQFNRGCGISMMKQKYDKCMDFLHNSFPDFMNNKYLRFGQPKGQTGKIKIATSVTILLKRVHLDKLIFYFIAGLK